MYSRSCSQVANNSKDVNYKGRVGFIEGVNDANGDGHGDLTTEQVPQDVDSAGSEAETGDELYIDNNEGEVDEEYDEGIPSSVRSTTRQNSAKGTKRSPKLREPRTPSTPRRPRKRAKKIDTPSRSSAESGRIDSDSTNPYHAFFTRRPQPQLASGVQSAVSPELHATPTAAGADPTTDPHPNRASQTGTGKTAGKTAGSGLLSPPPSNDEPGADQPNASTSTST